MLRKLLVLVLTIAISLLWLSYPAYAASSNDGAIKPTLNDIYTVLNSAPRAIPQRLSKAAQKSSQFVKRCLLSKPIDGVDEIGCTLLKESIQAGVVITVCYTADGIATSVFPPAGTLAPACNYLGIAKASQKVIAH